MKHGALMHEPQDDVAVVVADVASGAKVRAVTLDGREITTVTAIQDIPLGHKIAVRDIEKGKDVIKYGRPIGKATLPIQRGAHVHVHNIKSARWK